MGIRFRNVASIGGTAHAEENQPGIDVVHEYFLCLDEHRFSDLSGLLAYEDREEYEEFIANSANSDGHIGYFNFKNVEIITCSLLSSDEVDMSLIDREKLDNYSDWQCWECIVDVDAYRETKYLSTGYNCYWVYTALDSNATPLVVACVRFRDYGYSDEMISTMSYDAPVAAPDFGIWEMPSVITVRNYGDVDFRTYCEVVTVNEFGTDSYNEEARKAVAMCVKQYGWNRTLVQKYSSEEYDVKENASDQVYNPSKAVTSKVTAAVDTIWDYVMLTCDQELFCSFYVNSSAISEYAVYHGGMLSQTEANEQGNDGKTWIEILHYFYDYGTYNSEMTQGIISVISLSHSPTGDKVYVSGDLNYHYTDCTICGCIHGAARHVWKTVSAKYTCTTCGMTSSFIPGTILSVKTGEMYE